MFSGKKEGYLESLSQPFLDTRLSEFSKPLEASATCSWLCKSLLDQTDSFTREIPSWQRQHHLPLEFFPVTLSDMNTVMDLPDCSSEGRWDPSETKP